MTVQVTNVEEPGTVMLSTLQPQVGVVITATLTDPDTIDATDQAAVTWQWYRGNTPIAGATNADVISNVPTSTYTPAAGDIGSVLSAKAMYDDMARAMTRQPSNIRPMLPVKPLRRTSIRRSPFSRGG